MKAQNEQKWARRRALVTQLRGEGWGVERLAARYQCSYQTMRGRLEEWGLIMEAQAKPDLAARNERVLKMVREGVKDAEIVKRLKAEYPAITRGAVIGLRHRNGMPKGAEERARACSMNGRRNSMGSNLRHKLKAAPQIEHVQRADIAPPRILAPVAAPIADEAPQTIAARWVEFLERTGCAWVQGDVKMGTARFCNAPRCLVKYAGAAKPELVPYCAEHWRRRRSSSFTRVA